MVLGESIFHPIQVSFWKTCPRFFTWHYTQSCIFYQWTVRLIMALPVFFNLKLRWSPHKPGSLEASFLFFMIACLDACLHWDKLKWNEVYPHKPVAAWRWKLLTSYISWVLANIMIWVFPLFPEMWHMKGIRVDTTTKHFFEWLMNNKDNGVMGKDNKVARINVFYFGKI